MAKRRRVRRVRVLDDETRSIAEDRFRQLIVDRGRELGNARGWKKLVAAELEMSPEHLSRLVAGQRGVSVETMERTARKFGFGPGYFFEAREGTTYLDYRTRAQTLHELERLALRLLGTAAGEGVDRALALELAEAVRNMEIVREAETLLEMDDDEGFSRKAILFAAGVIAFAADTRKTKLLDPLTRS